MSLTLDGRCLRPTGGGGKVRTAKLALMLGAVACVPCAAQSQTPKPAKVKITAPANGATVSGPVKVTLQVTGVEIVPATDERPGTEHHHLRSEEHTSELQSR